MTTVSALAHRRRIRSLLLVAILATSAPAAADDGGAEARIAADGAWFRGSGTYRGFVADGEIFALRVAADVPLGRVTVLELQYGVSHASMGGLATPIGKFDMEDDTRWLNPYIGLAWISTWPRTRLRTGIGVSLPLASDDDGEARANLLGSLGAWGMRDPWLFPEGLAALVIPAQLRLRPARWLDLHADAAVALMLRTIEQSAGEIGPAAQVRIGPELRLAPAIGLGARASVVWLPGRDGDPEQLAIEPFLAFHLGPLELGASLVVNLDGPFGPSMTAHRQWGLHATAAATF